MNCTICHKPVELIPSAKERARKHGGKASEYIAMFSSHAECFVAKRSHDTSELIKRHYGK